MMENVTQSAGDRAAPASAAETAASQHLRMQGHHAASPVSVALAAQYVGTSTYMVDNLRGLAASAINMLGNDTEHPEVDDAIHVLAAIRDLAGVLGLRLDLAGQCLGENPFGGLEEWLLTPIERDLKKEAARG